MSFIDTDLEKIILKPPSTINDLDDKNTIIYKYIDYYQKPFQFFTLKHNKVYSIYDLFKDFKYYDVYFQHFDILMNYYEYILIDNKIVIDEKLNVYKQWIINNNHKKLIIKKIDDIEEYDVKDLLKWYKKEYKINYDELREFLKNDNIVYYTENISDIFKNFAKKGDIKILNELLTENDYNQIKFQSLITPDENLLIILNHYKEKYPELQHIKYDRKYFMNEYHEWIINTNNKLLENLKIYNIINNIQKLLITKQNIKNSPIKWEKLEKIYNPYIKNRRYIPIDIHDGLDIFNDAKLSSIAPFLIYNDYNQHLYYKVHESLTQSIDNIEVEQDNIYYQIIKNNPIYEIFYNLQNNELKINYINVNSIGDDYDIINILELDKVVDYNMDGTFYLWDLEYDEQNLLNYILCQDNINKILFVDDKLKNLTKKTIHLKYIPYLFNNTNTINIQITQLFLNEDKVVEIMENDAIDKIKLQLKKRTNIPYIEIKVKNLYDSKSFLLMIKSLLSLFSLKKSNDFNALLSTLEFKKEKDVDENLKKLKNMAPDAFIEGYANFCDIKKRPTPIEETDIKAYIKNKSKEFKFKPGELEKFKTHAVLDFKLANDDTIHLVCDHPEDKYPYLKSTLKAKKMNNLDKFYEELPCCKTLPPKLEKIVKKETHINSFNIITYPGTTGELKPDVKYFLQYYDKKVDNNFIRLGVINDNLSLLHCLCLSMNDKKYIETNDKTNYIKNLLKTIGKNINFGLLKQELYDLSIEEIEESFLNLTDEFLDPNLYYRAFEEYYNINIYVFNPDTIMELPRFNMFHSRPVRDYRNTVLIYKQNNHCELIINHNEKQFDQKMSIYCHSFLQKILNTITITQEHNYNNMYSYADHLTFFTFKGKISQYIDNQGKLRALTFELKNEKLTLITIPSQPENLPIHQTIEYCSLETALNTIANPTAVSINNNNINGVWFNIYDIKEGEFIPTKNTKNTLNLPVKPFPQLLNENNNISNYYNLKKILSFVIQIIQWIYLLSIEYNIISTLDEFIKTLLVVKNSSYLIYNQILSLDRRLPIYENFDDYMDFIENKCPNMIYKNKIILYNQEFYEQIKHYLEFYTMTYQKIPKIISGYYTNVNDFTNYNSIVFLNKENLKAWQYDTTEIKIQNSILTYNPYPFLYQHLNQIYIVQYVKNETLEEAMVLCDVWLKEKQNLGFDNTNIYAIDKNPNIYKLTDTGQIELIQKGNINYSIINYDYKPDKVGKYASMLMI